jgi:group I intron endonuclease
MHGIYIITSPTGRNYVGQSVNIHQRWMHYKLCDCKEQPKLYNSFIKYGVENHKFSVIEECKIEILTERERYWQEYYDVINKGLNCKLVTTLEKTGFFSEETRKKISDALKGRVTRINYKHSEETKRKIGIANKGKPAKGFTGKHSEESKIKMSNSKKGRITSEETKIKLSLAMKGRKSKLKGRVFSDEEKKRIYGTRIGQKRNLKNKTQL